jgi:hypothetical protein
MFVHPKIEITICSHLNVVTSESTKEQLNPPKYMKFCLMYDPL